MDSILKKLCAVPDHSQQSDHSASSVELIKEGTALIMAGKATHAQIGSFLTALKLTHLDSNPSIVNAVSLEMKAASLQITFPPGSKADVQGTVDIVGTGGDGQNTFNVSTASGIVCAGAGLLVAKVSYIYINLSSI
jgi:anthranilate phosphoribosyltransferase